MKDYWKMTKRLHEELPYVSPNKLANRWQCSRANAGVLRHTPAHTNQPSYNSEALTNCSLHREWAVWALARKAKQTIRGWSMEPDAVQRQNKPFECRSILLGGRNTTRLYAAPVLWSRVLFRGGVLTWSKPGTQIGFALTQLFITH